jgi:hypothetical protein
LSREFQSAYRDIHDLILARSSAGKLAKLLLSWTPTSAASAKEIRVRSGLTHEEMAQMIGASARDGDALVERSQEEAIDPLGRLDPGHSKSYGVGSIGLLSCP